MKWSGACLLAVAVLIYATYKDMVGSPYEKQLYATCIVKTIPFFGRGLKTGTGVLLNNGYIITNKHVVDSNSDGFVDDFEKHVSIEFLFPSPKSYIGEVIANSNGSWRSVDIDDIALVKLNTILKSNVSVATDKEYSQVKFGDMLFAIGNSDGESPHLTIGPKSTGNFRGLDRAGLSIYHGNSGGGIYDQSSGKLIGITTSIRRSPYEMVPDWSEYITAPTIRKFLREKNLEDRVIRRDYGAQCFILTILIGAVFLLWMANLELKNVARVKK